MTRVTTSAVYDITGKQLVDGTHPACSCRCLVLSKNCWFHGSSFSRGRPRTPKTPGAVQSSRLAVPKASHADAALQERILTESVLKLQVVRRIQEPRRVCTTARLSLERQHCASLGATSEACRCRAWRKLMSTGSRVLVTAFGCGCCYHRSSPVHAHSRSAWVVPSRFANRCHRGNQDRREGLQVWVVGRPNGWVRAEIRVSKLPQRWWLSPARWATR